MVFPDIGQSDRSRKMANNKSSYRDHNVSPLINAALKQRLLSKRCHTRKCRGVYIRGNTVCTFFVSLFLWCPTITRERILCGSYQWHPIIPQTSCYVHHLEHLRIEFSLHKIPSHNLLLIKDGHSSTKPCKQRQTTI